MTGLDPSSAALQDGRGGVVLEESGEGVVRDLARKPAVGLQSRPAVIGRDPQRGADLVYPHAVHGSRIVNRKGDELYVSRGNIGAAYRQEHKDLVDSITSGKPIVELMQTADSSLTAAMGRMSAYSGRSVSWEFMTEDSKLDTFKHGITMNQAIESPGPAVPGRWTLT